MDDNIPSSTGDPGLDAKLDTLDDNLQPLKDKDDLKTDEQAKPEKESKETEEVEEPNKEDESETESKDTEDSESTEEVSDDEGYAIDDGDEEKSEDTKDTPTDASPEPSQLSAEQRYILDGLVPITVKGTVGSDDKVQEFKVLSPEYLPQGFKYVDDRESATANKAFGMLESKAAERQNEFRNQETTKSAKEFEAAEKASDRADIGRLQREGDLPKFKLEPDDPKFDSDPAAVQVQEILDFKDKKNAEYLEQANAGRPYKHIGFEEAFLMFKRENPKDPAQDKEDQERVDLAKRTGATQGTDSLPKARIHSGMGSMDLDQLIEERTQGW